MFIPSCVGLGDSLGCSGQGVGLEDHEAATFGTKANRGTCPEPAFPAPHSNIGYPCSDISRLHVRKGSFGPFVTPILTQIGEHEREQNIYTF